MLASSGVKGPKVSSESLGFCTPGTPERTADLDSRPTLKTVARTPLQSKPSALHSHLLFRD